MIVRGRSSGERGRALRRGIVFVVLALATASSFVATAETRPAPSGKLPAKRGVEALGAAASADAAASAEKAATPEVAAVVDQKTLDGGQRVFRFGEVEVEGRLKNPQIIYFLRRVRAELAVSDLGHRSFMRELSDTKDERGF